MHAFKLLIFALLAVFGFSSPTPSAHESLEKRQRGFQSYNCEGNRYNALQIGVIRAQACFLINTGGTVGSGQGYPKRFRNKEKFDLPVSPPYYEFPILGSLTPYLGGPPGPDRVIMNDRCQFATVVTHTNAPGGPNSFKECDEV